MALKKSQLYSSLWQSCDELRGGMDASQYKDYVLTLLFMKYVSDKHAGDPDALIEVPVGGGFADMAKLKGHKEIGDHINKIIGRLAEANDLRGVIDQADFNDESKLGAGKDMQDRLSKLVAIFEGLDFQSNRTSGDDLLGDAYEYLMRHFATESGKSKGQFYTPAEVSRIMARVVGIGPETTQDQTIYDPTCGSGSLLLKAADEAPGGISVYGQEMDNATWSLARMNFILHGHETAELWRGNTLAAPHFKDSYGGLKTFDFAVANPPFSAKSWSNGLDPENDQFRRFSYGIPPSKNGDYAFLLHLITSLKSRGKGAIILPHGVLFRGNREAVIRRTLIERGYIKGVIGLPANLFYGTGIPACILVVDKGRAAVRDGIFMIDASRGFIKDGAKNRLREQDIHRIVDVFERQSDEPGYARMVPTAEIKAPANDYNLNIPRYIDASGAEDIHDLNAHLRGGIPKRDVDALAAYWDVFPSLREALFSENGRPGYYEARLEARRVRAAILDHDEFVSYRTSVAETLGGWRAAHRPRLWGVNGETLPGTLIANLSADLLRRFADLPLLDRYAIYQRLMDYWDAVMQDDIHLVVADGWCAAAQPRGAMEDKGKRIHETPDLTVKRQKYKLDLVPARLVIVRYFESEQQAIDELLTAHEYAARALDEYVEEHGGEGGLMEDCLNDKGKATKASLKSRLTAIKGDDDSNDGEERSVLARCLALLEAEAETNKAAKAAQAALDQRVLSKYADLTETQIQTLVVDDKWLADIGVALEGEVQRLIQQLAQRIQVLEERYADPLPDLECRVAESSAKVEGHLRRMGLPS